MVSQNGGGTHTGNPELVASLSLMTGAAIRTACSPGEWQVERYIEGGTEVLNPALLSIPATASRGAGKRASTGDSMVVGVDTVFVDTVLVVRDTVLETSRTVAGNDTTVLVNKKLVTNLIYAVDTLLVYDTVYTEQGKETTAGDSQSTREAVPFPEFSVSFMVPMEDSISYGLENTARADDTLPRSIPVEKARYLNSASEEMLFLSKVRTSPTVRIYEEYTDADGDALLYRSNAPARTSVRYYRECDSGSGVTALTALFDAGTDTVFTTTGDNRILSLRRNTVAGGDTIQKVVWAPEESPDPAVRSMRLYSISIPDASSPDDPAVTEAVYLFTARQDEAEYRLSGISRLFSYTGEISGIALAFTPLHTVSRLSDSAVSGTAVVKVTYTDGIRGVLTAEVDPATGLTGTYAIEGRTFEVIAGMDGTLTIAESTE